MIEVKRFNDASPTTEDEKLVMLNSSGDSVPKPKSQPNRENEKR